MTSRLTCGYEYTRIYSRDQMAMVLADLQAGENIQIFPADGRWMWRQGLCDWCGEILAKGEGVPGYEGKPTHKACQREALRSFRRDNAVDMPDERREPAMVDYPNGQGVFD